MLQAIKMCDLIFSSDAISFVFIVFDNYSTLHVSNISINLFISRLHRALLTLLSSFINSVFSLILIIQSKTDSSLGHQE